MGEYINELRETIRFYTEEEECNRKAAMLSRAMSVGGVVLTGLGTYLVAEGRPVGVLLAPAGAYFSVKMAEVASEESVWAEQDRARANAALEKLARIAKGADGQPG